MRAISRTVLGFLANLAKHDIIPQYKQQHPRRLISEAIKRYQIDLVIDVGANRGQFAEDLIASGYRGTILSFEPTKSTFDALVRKAKSHPNWFCLNVALGSEVGSLTINRHEDDSLNSFLPSNTLAEKRYKNLNLATETVEVKRLDTVMAELVESGRVRENYSAFLKLDTQGFDLKVLEGSECAMKNIHVLQTEASVNQIYNGMPDYRETITAVHNLGFRPAAFSTVSRDNSTLQFVEFDLIAIKVPGGV